MKTLTRLFARLLLCAALALTAGHAYAQSGSATFTAKFPTATASKLVDADPAITSVEIVNNGSVTVYLGSSSTVTAAAAAATDGKPLYVSNRVVFNKVGSPIYGITASGTGNLRISIVRGGGTVETARLQTSGIANSAAANTVPMSNGSDLVAGNVKISLLTSAITANSTTCSDTSGSLAVTSNATGLGSLFRCDGTNYQLLATYSGLAAQTDTVTIATTGNSDAYMVVPYTAALAGVDCSGTSALAASDTNFITFSITNLGQSGGGSTALLAATAANTTQATGGSALTADTKRSLTLHGTSSNLNVTAGDRLRFRAAATGTLAGTVTFWKCTAKFTRLS